VIIEEIRGYLDDPAEYAQMLFQQAMFGSSALGREICGEESDVRALPADGIRGFWAATYRPAKAVVALAGDLTHAEALELTGRSFGTGNGVERSFEPAPVLPAGPRILTGRRDTTQAQLCLGVPALARDHPDAWALAVLNAILGDGMSSRLFLALVDRDALAYDVGSGIVEYADAGAIQVTAGVDPGRVGRALAAILREIAALRDEALRLSVVAPGRSLRGLDRHLRLAA
jgi:predicted Zn-dependent peptidase